MDPQPVLVHELCAVVPPESLVVEVVRVTPPDAECAVGMDILGASRAGKIVCTTWPNDSSTYIAVFSDGGRLNVTVDQALALHQRFLSAPDVVPMRVSIMDRRLGWQFDANEGDMKRILRRSVFPGSVVVEYVDAEDKSPVGVSVAQCYDDKMHIGICFGKQAIGGQVVYLVIFDDGVRRRREKGDGEVLGGVHGWYARAYHGRAVDVTPPSGVITVISID